MTVSPVSSNTVSPVVSYIPEHSSRILEDITPAQPNSIVEDDGYESHSDTRSAYPDSNSYHYFTNNFSVPNPFIVTPSSELVYYEHGPDFPLSEPISDHSSDHHRPDSELSREFNNLGNNPERHHQTSSPCPFTGLYVGPFSDKEESIVINEPAAWDADIELGTI